MTLEQAKKIRKQRLAAEQAWTDHHERDGRFSHGSWRKMTAEEMQAEEVLEAAGVQAWVIE